jgi:His-Xaa-Ser repeat protein HxsA
MKMWKYVLALSLAGLLVATSAAAQSSSPSATKSPGQTDGSASVASPSTTSGAEASKVESSKPAAKRKSSARSAASREQVKAVQQALKEKGYDPGAIDGALGPKTRAAIQDFQKKEGLTVTGRIDTETLAKLGVGSATTAKSESRPGTEAKPASGDSSSGSASPAGTSSEAASTK